MPASYLPLLLAALVGVVYYLTNRLELKKRQHPHKIASFSAGVSITYILLELFPLFTERASQGSKLVFLSVLGGFIIHHIIEKEIYIHNRRHELVKKLGIEEEVFSFVYHVILGILLVTLTTRRPLDGILFFIPVGMFVFISTLPLTRHAAAYKTLFLSSATLWGTLFSLFVWETRPLWVESTLLGLAVGVLLFTIVRHHIPFGRTGNLGYFMLGFFFYSIVIVGSWYL